MFYFMLTSFFFKCESCATVFRSRECAWTRCWCLPSAHSIQVYEKQIFWPVLLKKFSLINNCLLLIRKKFSCSNQEQTLCLLCFHWLNSVFSAAIGHEDGGGHRSLIQSEANTMSPVLSLVKILCSWQLLARRLRQPLYPAPIIG